MKEEYQYGFGFETAVGISDERLHGMVGVRRGWLRAVSVGISVFRNFLGRVCGDIARIPEGLLEPEVRILLLKRL